MGQRTEKGQNQMQATLLCISADQGFRGELESNLGSEGYEIELVCSGEDGCQRILTSSYDAVVVDSRMEDRHAFDVIREVCQSASLAVFFVTETEEVTEHVVGLELGADDVMVKPVDDRELVARLRSVLRRIQAPQPLNGARRADALEFGGLSLACGSRQVALGGASVQLTAAESSILERLMTEPGQVVAKDDLSEFALGRRLGSGDRSLDTHVSRLRRKLRHIGSEGVVGIQCIRSRGYMISSSTEVPA